MTQSADASAAVGGQSHGRRTGQFVRLRNWPVRSKLIAVLIIPALAFLIVGGINIASSVEDAVNYGRGATLAGFGRDVTRTVHELQTERDLAAGFISNGRSASLGNDLTSQQTSVDAAAASFRASAGRVGGDVGGSAKAKINAASAALDQMRGLREAVRSGSLPAGAVAVQYSDIISSLLAVDSEIGQRSGNRELNERVMALNNLSQLKEVSSQVRGRLYAISFAGSFGFGEFQELSGLLARQQADSDRFHADAVDQQHELYDSTVNGQAVLAAKRITDNAVNRQQGQLGVDPQQWFAASTTQIELLRSVETNLLNAVISQSQQLRSSAQRQAIATGVVVGAILLIALLTSLLVARSMIEPLRRLRSGALDVAHNRLPRVIDALRGPDASGAEVAVEPIDVTSRDEIGDVAQTFDELHRAAVRLASEQAVLRSNVNTIFVNLSRRSQGLVERQLQLIDQLEAGEQDADQLSHLFRLDHLATRMRRNSENLLVLAGESEGRRWSRPVALVDVVRAAVAEVEQYDRVQLAVVPEVAVLGQAINHLVHLLAELFENATQFSPPESKVTVHGERHPDGGAMIEIVDQGIGMEAHELASANQRLAEPPVFDVSISQMMGLFVVARLASRLGVSVRLRESKPSGLSAVVQLPSQILARPDMLPSDLPATGDGVAPVAEASGNQHGGRPLGRPLAPQSVIPGADAADRPGVNGERTPNQAEPTAPERTAAERMAAERIAAQQSVPERSDFDPLGPVPQEAHLEATDEARDLADGTPIYDSVSRWFNRRRPPSPARPTAPREAPIDSAATPPARPAQPVEPAEGWASASDEGWLAAEAMRTPSSAGTTGAGLPIRVPMSNLVPGGVATPAESRSSQAGRLEPEGVRERLSSYYRGISRGRQEGDRATGDAEAQDEER